MQLYSVESWLMEGKEKKKLHRNNNIQLVDEVEHDITNYQNRSRRRDTRF